jgi:glycosyltransferase involved in cell wall biosynthesis
MISPSSRIRGLYMGKYLSQLGFDVKVFSPKGTERITYFKKCLYLIEDFLGKIAAVMFSERKTLIFVQKGLSLLPQLSFIFFIASKFLFKKRLIYDIDDGLFLKQPFVINNLIRLSDLVVAGGHELFNYVKKYNKNVILIPTSVDLRRYTFNAFRENDHVRLGFIGSLGTTKYLKLLLKPLKELAKSYDFELRIISSPSYAGYRSFNGLFENFKKGNVKVKLIPWSLQQEFYQLQNIDIGLAPLFNGEWEKYKCGFKLINYMAAGIPPVASKVGEHCYIIQDGINGFLCENEQQWTENLRKLIEDKNLREKLGIAARKTVEEKYSLERNAKKIAKILAKYC